MNAKEVVKALSKTYDIHPVDIVSRAQLKLRTFNACLRSQLDPNSNDLCSLHPDYAEGVYFTLLSICDELELAVDELTRPKHERSNNHD